MYGLFFIDAALKQDKPIWGTCHGAQLGYVHAGGKLGRLFKYKEGGYEVDFKKTGQKNEEEETWHVGKSLNTHKKDSEYFEYGMAAYPVPEIFAERGRSGKDLSLNKDFEHSLAMIPPVPSNINVISYHPLSQYQEKMAINKYRASNDAFKGVLKNQTIIDAYKYRTMLGTQYHPQYTYDDLETSVVFEYLVKEIADRHKE